MGNSHEALFRLRIIILSLMTVFLLCAGNSLSAAEDGGAEATLSGFALPEYKHGNESLQFILYGDSATNLGGLIHLRKLILDIVFDDINSIEQIVALDKAVVYPITTSAANIRKYWKDKKHCRALLFTNAAVYDKKEKTLRGNGKAYFRSREMDIDGVGFDAFYKTRLIHIRSEVHVLIRSGLRNSSLSLPGESSTGQNSPERKISDDHGDDNKDPNPHNGNKKGTTEK